MKGFLILGLIIFTVSFLYLGVSIIIGIRKYRKEVKELDVRDFKN